MNGNQIDSFGSLNNANNVVHKQSSIVRWKAVVDGVYIETGFKLSSKNGDNENRNKDYSL